MDHILFLCTGNATRSVLAGAALRAHAPQLEVMTAGTLSIDGLPMSWRTQSGLRGRRPHPARAPQPSGDRRPTSTGPRW